MNIFWIIIVVLIFIVVLLKYFEKKLYINKKLSEMSVDLEGKERYFRVLMENETVYIKADNEEYAIRNIIYSHNSFQNYALEMDLVSKNTKKHLSYTEISTKTLADVVQNTLKFFEEEK